MLEHAAGLSFKFKKNKVQKLVSEKFLHSYFKKVSVTYNTISFETYLVKIFKLGLALVKLVEIRKL